MENSSRWKKICSMVLAVCLLGTLLVSNQSFGVLAEEENKQGEEISDRGENNQKNLSVDVNNENIQEMSDVTDEIESSEVVEDDFADASKEKNIDIDAMQEEQNDVVLLERSESNEPVLQQSTTWEHTNSNVTIFGDGSDPGEITVQTGNKDTTAYAGNKTVIWDYSIESTTTVTDAFTMKIVDCGIMSDDESLEVYHIADNETLEVVQNVQREEGNLSFLTTQFGEYIAVSNVATVDLAKGNVTVSDTTIKGKRQDGVEITVDFSQSNEKKYRIAQSNSEKKVSYCVNFSTNNDYAANKTIVLDGINTDNSINIPANEKTVNATLLLRNINQVHHIFYGTGEHNKTTEEEKNNDNSSLIINAYDASGELYIPYKMENQEEERNYVLTTSGSDNIGGYWSLAGIGGNGNINNCTGLTIAGGTLRVLGQNANGATAIGGGGNGDAKISITGGNIAAICSSTGAAIGGGIGWVNRGGYAKVNISGGTVYAENMGYYTRNAIDYGGVAIGSGSSMNMYGSAADINISGGTVTAYARYGNAIGSGNSYQGSSAKAIINISGNGTTVFTNALGGGTSKEAKGGSAEITLSDNARVNCVKYSEITDKLDTSTKNILDAFGIGGGNSAGNENGGNAIVNISGGSLICSGGNIGGGNANGTGNGGDASIYVTGGILDCSSIGGGDSVSGMPGAVTSTDHQSAGVVVTGNGSLKAGTIGGGTNENGDIGFATAEISGGTIQGQFILANTDTSKHCFFHMTGGTINNEFLGSDKYLKSQENGGAVYLSDPNGEVNISGGTIENSKAELGGAVYMTAGTVTLSGNAIIQNCHATGNIEKNTEAQGGAFYLDNGIVNISGGELLKNSATDGAGVYMKGGSLNVSGGTIVQNEATKTGGGAYVQSGTISMTGGTIGAENVPNKANRGAGVYIAGGILNVNGGNIRKNEATEAGGGAYIASGDLNISAGSIDENIAPDGAGAYLAGGNLTISDKGVFNKNGATQNGGAAYLAKGTLILNGGTVSSNTADKNGGGFYAADGAVRMFGGNITGNTAKEAGGGLFVSSDTSAADIVIRSGDITGNIAGTSGGGIAVASTSGNARNDKVIVGLLAEHKDLAVDENDPAKRVFTEFLYTDDKDKQEHTHKSCPVLKDNKASDDGGGIYMESSNAELDIYCLIESGNSSVSNTAGNGAMMAGGTVTIGDATHNTENAYGNIVISSSILVEGGNVNIWGNMKNPLFKNNILVDIKGLAEESNGSFTDNRSQTTSEINYKIHYFENFTEEGATKPTGRYTAKQYEEGADISPEGALFSHEGWKIVGWANEEDKNNNKITYNIGGNLIGGKGDHSAWGNDNTKPLILYAIWQRITYTVKFDANAGTEKFSGMMNNQGFTYGVAQQLFANQYKIKGKQFSGWSTSKDENGIKYAADYNESKMTTADNNPTIILYAQWVNCTHEKKQYTQSSSAANTIEINCDCGYQTTITLSGVTAYYNGNPHPASLDITGDALLDETPVIQYQKKQDNESFGNMPEGENVPTNVGKYQASITVGEITVSVEYEIQSATEGIDISAKIAAGQYFKEFTNEENISLSQDDAFTVQFNVFHLKSEIYKTEPELAFSENLPVGTTIIMQNGNQYAYLKMDSSEKTIKLTEFTVMGNSSKFQYVADEIQTYRFIVDFSQTNNTIGNMNVSLTYDPSGDVVQKLEKTVALNCTKKSAFQLNFIKDANTLSITAPDNTGNNRWNKMEQILIFQGEDTIPSDAKLTVTNGETTEISLNAAKQFVVSITWATSQNIQLSLTTEQLAKVGNYSFEVSLYAGASDGQTLIKAKSMNIAVNTNITLVAQTDIQPSLKLSGTQRIVGVQDTALSLNVEMKNIESSSLSVKIQKKTGDSYGGDYLTGASVKAGENTFSLTGITEPGSYCLSVTGATAEQKKVIVPYYFVVQ